MTKATLFGSRGVVLCLIFALGSSAKYCPSPVSSFVWPKYSVLICYGLVSSRFPGVHCRRVKAVFYMGECDISRYSYDPLLHMFFFSSASRNFLLAIWYNTSYSTSFCV